MDAHTDRVLTTDEDRALDVAHRDFIHRVELASHYDVVVAAEFSGFVVSYRRRVDAGEAMIADLRARSGVTYRIDRTFRITDIGLPDPPSEIGEGS